VKQSARHQLSLFVDTSSSDIDPRNLTSLRLSLCRESAAWLRDHMLPIALPCLQLLTLDQHWTSAYLRFSCPRLAVVSIDQAFNGGFDDTEISTFLEQLPKLETLRCHGGVLINWRRRNHFPFLKSLRRFRMPRMFTNEPTEYFPIFSQIPLVHTLHLDYDLPTRAESSQSSWGNLNGNRLTTLSICADHRWFTRVTLGSDLFVHVPMLNRFKFQLFFRYRPINLTTAKVQDFLCGLMGGNDRAIEIARCPDLKRLELISIPCDLQTVLDIMEVYGQRDYLADTLRLTWVTPLRPYWEGRGLDLCDVDLYTLREEVALTSQDAPGMAVEI
jgi:hypothetical protein